MDSTPILVSQLTLGAVSSWFLQLLKNSKWFPLLQEESSKIIKLLYGLISSAAAITGLNYVYDPTAHTLVIQNFSLAMVAIACWHWLTQFVMQEGWYQAVFNKMPAPPVQIQTASGATAVITGTKEETKKIQDESLLLRSQKEKALLDAQQRVREAQDELKKL